MSKCYIDACKIIKIINTKNNEKTLFLIRNGVFFEKKVDFFEIYVTIVT